MYVVQETLQATLDGHWPQATASPSQGLPPPRTSPRCTALCGVVGWGEGRGGARGRRCSHDEGSAHAKRAIPHHHSPAHRLLHPPLLLAPLPATCSTEVYIRKGAPARGLAGLEMLKDVRQHLWLSARHSPHPPHPSPATHPPTPVQPTAMARRITLEMENLACLCLQGTLAVCRGPPTHRAGHFAPCCRLSGAAECTCWGRGSASPAGGLRTLRARWSGSPAVGSSHECQASAAGVTAAGRPGGGAAALCGRACMIACSMPARTHI